MKIWIKSLICISLSFMCLFTCVGYALVSEHMNITGTARAIPPKAVYITSVTTSGLGGAEATVNNFSGTVINSKVTLSPDVFATVAVFEVTVYNNSDVPQGFNAMIYTVGSSTYDNELISLTPSILRGTVVEPGEYLTFSVTAQFADFNNKYNNVLNSIVNYEFVPVDELPDSEIQVAVTNVIDKFVKILNTPESYKTLSDEIEANYDGRDWTATYIGNVIGTEDYENNNDTAVVNNLFDGILMLNINGVDTKVTVIIKRESLDNNSSTGATYKYGTPSRYVYDTEMTLYVTAEDLSAAPSLSPVPVYAVVFTIDQDVNGEPTGKWYQIGDLYSGSAMVVGYIGGESNGSFDTGTWKQAATNKTLGQIIGSLN